MQLDAYIEGLLFFKATPISKKVAANLLHVSEVELGAGIATLLERLAGGGLRLIETDTTIQLVTAPELSDFIETLQKTELKADIGKAGAETLAIILYSGPVTRLEIDSIRGVNSAYTLRTLMVRGLIERSASKTGGGYSFTATPELFKHLGITRREDMPDYARVMDELDTFVHKETTQAQ